MVDFALMAKLPHYVKLEILSFKQLPSGAKLQTLLEGTWPDPPVPPSWQALVRRFDEICQEIEVQADSPSNNRDDPAFDCIFRTLLWWRARQLEKCLHILGRECKRGSVPKAIEKTRLALSRAIRWTKNYIFYGQHLPRAVVGDHRSARQRAMREGFQLPPSINVRLWDPWPQG